MATIDQVMVRQEQFGGMAWFMPFFSFFSCACVNEKNEKNTSKNRPYFYAFQSSEPYFFSNSS